MKSDIERLLDAIESGTEYALCAVETEFAKTKAFLPYRYLCDKFNIVIRTSPHVPDGTCYFVAKTKRIESELSVDGSYSDAMLRQMAARYRW